MKKLLLSIAVAATLATTARADYNPIALLTNSFNADVIVESNAPAPLSAYTTGTIDQGTNNQQNTLYEVGWNQNQPWCGVPLHGSTFTAFDGVHQYKMPSDYSVDSCLMVGGATYPGGTAFCVHHLSGSLTNGAPAAGNVLSILFTSSGNSPSNTIHCVVHHQDGTTEPFDFGTPDWFNGAVTPAYLCRGRVDLNGGRIQNINNTTATKLLFQDLTLANTGSPVTSVDFTYVSGVGRSFFLGMSVSGDGGTTWTPMTISGGFNMRPFVRVGVPVNTSDSVLGRDTVTLDGGTNNTGFTYYEMGFDTAAPTTGLPHAGASVTPVANHNFNMPSTYAGNCSLMLSSDSFGSGTLTLASATTASAVSVLGGSGGGQCNINYTVHHADNGTPDTGSIGVFDWFTGNPGFSAAGRFRTEDLAFDNVGNTGGVKIYATDITGIRTDSPVTSIDFTYSSGGRGTLFALATSMDNTNFSPVGVSGYNADSVIESSGWTAGQLSPSPHPGALRGLGLVTATMDSGTNLTGGYNTTWYERGYYSTFPGSGLPHPGEVITSLADPTKHYRMPTNYAINNAIYIDAANTNANIVIAPPYQTYSALSFLNSCANGSVTNQVIMQYQDGTSETNVFVGSDWFNNVPVAYAACGRVQMDTRTMQADPGRSNPTNLTANATAGGSQNDPRLYEAGFALLNLGSKVTNVNLRFIGGANGSSREVIMAVSAVAGAIAPIFNVQPVGVITNDGSTGLKLGGHANGVGAITYQWQGGAPGSGVYTNLTGAEYSGVTSTNLIISTATYPQDQADYVLLATSGAGTSTSSVANVLLLSTLPDVLKAGDSISAYAPNGGSSNPGEDAPSAIDHVSQKYLNLGPASGGGPYVGPLGFVVTPSVGDTVVSVMRIYTANDSTDRDPTDFVLEGSNDGGGTWAPIASGSLNLPNGRNGTGSTPLNPYAGLLQEVRFVNSTSYQMYRWSVNNVKNDSQALMQVAEVELRGTKPGAPAIAVDVPATTIAYAGTPAVFATVVVGDTPLFYQWTSNGVSMSDGGRVSGSQSSTLTIANAQSTDGATYQLGVSNAASGGVSTMSTASSLYVEVAPDFNTNGLGWTLNGDTVNGGPSIVDNVMTFTDGSGGENRSAWYQFKQNIDSFKASWTYQDIGGGGADGTAFVIQNDSRGTSALGGGGGGMGYTGITPSAALMFNIYNGAPGGASGINFNTNGTGVSVGNPFSSTAPVDIDSGDPIDTTITYANGIATVTLSDSVAGTTFTASQAMNIPSIVGGHTAWVGMTGAEGGITSHQTVSNFVYIALPALKLTKPGPSTVVLTWPTSVGGYQLQSSSVMPPVWANDSTPVTVVGGTNYSVTVSSTTGTRFYRLIATPYP
jgi:hypothetical protein